MSDLFASGLQLMLVGMGTVFTFLTLLVFATRGMSALVQHLFPEAVAQTVPAAGPATADVPPTAENPDAESELANVIAISAAIARHRQHKHAD